MKQEPVVSLVSEDLPSRLAIVESFGLIRVGGSEDDESNVVAGVAGATTVVIAIENVEGVARSHGVTALVPLGIAHGDEMSRIDGDEKLEINLFGRKLICKLREEVLKRTSCI